MDARGANDRIASKAEQLRFVSRVPMLCECTEPSCRAIVMIGLSEYHAIRRADGSSRLPAIRSREPTATAVPPRPSNTERRRSRTDLAVGYTTVRVLKTRWATGPSRSATRLAR
jgi:hypothetical protein